MIRSLLLLICLIAISFGNFQAISSEYIQKSTSSADEKADHDAIMDAVRTAIASNDFVFLSKMGDELRSTRARTPSGLWKLAVFHAGLQYYLSEGLEQERGCQYSKANFVRQWAAALPGSPAPIITDAALLQQQAWCFRGGSYAKSVAAEAWPKFRKGISAAYETLEKNSKLSSVDPEFYAVKLEVLRSMGASKASFRNVLDEATAREPEYHRTYFNAVWFYLPQWGGSYAEVEQFARYAADRTRASEKGGLYARVFWSLAECGCDIVERAADWSTMKQAMRDVYDRYPVAWNREYFAAVSCRAGDLEEGHYYIKAAHPETTDEAPFAALFAACAKQAQSGRSVHSN